MSRLTHKTATELVASAVAVAGRWYSPIAVCVMDREGCVLASGKGDDVCDDDVAMAERLALTVIQSNGDSKIAAATSSLLEKLAWQKMHSDLAALPGGIALYPERLYQIDGSLGVWGGLMCNNHEIAERVALCHNFRPASPRPGTTRRTLDRSVPALTIN